VPGFGVPGFGVPGFGLSGFGVPCGRKVLTGLEGLRRNDVVALG
jgi:hypothetical protein